MRFPARFLSASVIAGFVAVAMPSTVWAQVAESVDLKAPSAVSAALLPAADASSAYADTPPDAPDAAPGAISGTVMDSSGDIVPGAEVVLESGLNADRRTTTADDSASFEFTGVKPGVTYRIEVSAPGFDGWTSATMTLTAGQFLDLPAIKLKLTNAVTSVTVVASPEQIATEQVHIEEQQRVLGFIPNFYVVYDSKHAVAMTTKLKFQMAFRVLVDPITIAGTAFLAGVNQAADTPDYREGWDGYGERFGAVYTDGFTDTMLGGAILPSLLHQDPRYFYQGTGTVKSRLMHALSSPFICKGDNGSWQPNISSIGGDVISSAISTAYYPASNRTAGFVFEQLATSTAERAVSTVFQEFVVRKFTPSAKRQN